MSRCPSLPSHPQHELVKRQQFGHSGMLSFYMKGALEHSTPEVTKTVTTNSESNFQRKITVSQTQL